MKFILYYFSVLHSAASSTTGKTTSARPTTAPAKTGAAPTKTAAAPTKYGSAPAKNGATAGMFAFVVYKMWRCSV